MLHSIKIWALSDHDFIHEKQIKVDVCLNKNSYFKMDVNTMFVFLKQKKNKSGRRRFCIALAKVLLLFFSLVVNFKIAL